jgi:hypothetical protein
MGAIYSSAEEVLVWLGHDEKILKAIRFLQDAPEEPKEEHSYFWGRDPPLVLSREAKRTHNAVSHLLRLPYWNRVWIVQEVVLGRKGSILGGQASISFEALETRVFNFRLVRFDGQYPRPQDWHKSIRVMNAMRYAKDKGTPFELWELVLGK